MQLANRIKLGSNRLRGLILVVAGSGLILILSNLMGGPTVAFEQIIEHLSEDLNNWKVHTLILGLVLVIYGVIRYWLVNNRILRNTR